MSFTTWFFYEICSIFQGLSIDTKNIPNGFNYAEIKPIVSIRTLLHVRIRPICRISKTIIRIEKRTSNSCLATSKTGVYVGFNENGTTFLLCPSYVSKQGGQRHKIRNGLCICKFSDLQFGDLFLATN